MSERDKHNPESTDEQEVTQQHEAVSEDTVAADDEEKTEAQSDQRAEEEELVVGGSAEERPPPGRGLRYDLIGGAILLLVILAGLLFFFMSDDDAEEQTTQIADTTASPTDAAPAQPESQALVLAPPAEVEEWSPANFQLPPPQEVSDVEVALENAEALRAAGNLIEPQENNALAAYLSVLEEDPGNAQAETGIDAIAAQLVARANQAVEAGRMSDALELISAVETIRPNMDSLAELQARVEGEAEVIELLAAASEDLQAGDLTSPEGDNALVKYRQVLAVAPENADARQGIANVELRLLELATTAARELNFERANELLASAESVQEGPGAVEDTRENIETFRQQTFEQLAADAKAAIDTEDYARAQELITQAEQVALNDTELNELQQSLTRARVYSQYQPGDTFSDPFVSGAGQGPVMVVMPVGSFLMGSPDSEAGHRSYESPVHQVTFTDGFAVAQSEITVGQFEQFVAATGYTTDAESEGETSVYSEDSGRMEQEENVDWSDDFHGENADDDLPVIHVSWNDARAYAAWLAEITGEPYRLLSESEFEYALRGGTQSPYWWGAGSPNEEVENLTGEEDLSDAGRSWTNYFEDYEDNYWGPAPADEFATNPFGLYDIGGNVSEWVQDCWHDSYARAPTDGSAWVNAGCDRRVVRGAAWGSPPDRARSAYRISGSPDTHTTQVGFRVARDL